MITVLYHTYKERDQDRMTDEGILDQGHRAERASTVHCYAGHFRWRRMDGELGA